MNLFLLTYWPFASLFPWTNQGIGDVVVLPLAPLLLTSIAIVLLLLFLAGYLLLMSRHIRHLNNTLTATQLALAKEQKISAFGALAAAAAHELGSPLGTISLAAKDMASLLSPDNPMMEDAQLIISQGDRCRDILVELSKSIKEDADHPQESLPLSTLIERAAQPHKLPHIDFIIAKEAPDPEPHFYATPDLLHGLGNVLQNAFQFATSTVRVTLRWDKNTIEATIQDDGRGYPIALLPRLGEPQSSKNKDDARKGKYTGLGLGLFIAKTLLSQRQGQVHFSNDGGAKCLIKWPSAIQVVDSEKKG